MDVSNMLSTEERPCMDQVHLANPQQEQTHSHQYLTRRSMSATASTDQRYTAPPTNEYLSSNGAAADAQPPGSPKPKNVAFELRYGAPNIRGRLPMRVQIFPHDTTDSIVTTVKNFYGIYDGVGQGVSFEDVRGNTLIAGYENFTNDMIVYVRVIADYSQRPEYQGHWGQAATSPHILQKADEGISMLPPQPAHVFSYGQPPSRPGSRISRKQSASPKMSQGRSNSTQKSRSRSGQKGQGSSFQAGLDELNSDTHNGYSSSDGGAGSVTSSRKARSEQLASAEISVDNIVTGGRRKKAKFESSELPLFVPPQVPAPNSVSSVSPQRQSNGADVPSPFARPTQRTFMYNMPLQSPQSYTFNDQPNIAAQPGTPFTIPPVPTHGHRLRERSSGASLSTRSSLGSGFRAHGNILPTPDPTIASCISDEDVALQLMRLGDASNFSHGRTSASTFDDALSGKADVASSASSNSGEDSDATEQPSLPPFPQQVKIEEGEHMGPAPKKQRRHQDDVLPSVDSTEPSGDEVDGDYDDTVAKNEFGENDNKPRPKMPKVKKSRNGTLVSKVTKVTKTPKQAPTITKKLKVSTEAPTNQPPMSPASLPSHSRKASVASTVNFQTQLAPDEDDLSSKPRCQRCRKSKKGCDRQRPCQRCKDAGIGIEGCISEDEGNGRRGRYGRHMGISVKKTGAAVSVDNESETAGAILTGMAGGSNMAEKSKKRKR